jgi:hypothetical protein
MHTTRSLLSLSVLVLVTLLAGPALAQDKKFTRQGDTITGHVQVQTVEELKALEGVRTIHGSLTILNLDAPDLAPLRALTQVDGDPGRIIIMNTQLTSLAGLDGLAWAGSITVDSNRKLTSIAALGGLKTVDSIFTLSANPVLATLPDKGFRIGEQTKGFQGWLTIKGNKALARAAAEGFAKKCTVGRTSLD